MDDHHLRQLVREAVARHLGATATPHPPSDVPRWKSHASHARLTLPSGRDGEGPCLIEPTVRCSHCGYCQSWGH